MPKNKKYGQKKEKQSKPKPRSPFLLSEELKILFYFQQEKRYSNDAAKIYSIHVTNVIGGVASQCRRCALSSARGHSACVPCPAGHYMVSGTGECKSCQSNSIVGAEDPVGESACVPCGPNTQRNEVT